MNRHDFDGIAFCQRRKNVDEKAQGGGGQLDTVRLVLLIEDLDVLGFEFSRQVSGQGALAFDGCFYFALYGKVDRRMNNDRHDFSDILIMNAGTLFEINENRNKRNARY